MENQKQFTREENPIFFKLFDLHQPLIKSMISPSSNNWEDYEIFAKLKKDVNMNVWNGKHPVDSNITTHVCKSGTKVRVNMVSRFGDVGITEDLNKKFGYDARGLDADTDLYDYEFIETTKNQ